MGATNKWLCFPFPPSPLLSCLSFSLQLIKQTTGIWLAEPAARVDMPAICCNSICSDEDNDDDDDDDDDGLMTLMACVLELCHLQLVTCKTLSLKRRQTLCGRGREKEDVKQLVNYLKML